MLIGTKKNFNVENRNILFIEMLLDMSNRCWVRFVTTTTY